MSNKHDDLVKHVQDVEREERLDAQKATIDLLEKRAKEAHEHADKAEELHAPEVVMAPENPEIKRTRTLADQADQELEAAKKALKEMEKTDNPESVGTPATGLPAAGIDEAV